MVDVSPKETTRRRALAQALVRVSPALMKALREQELAKGDALTVAQLAGIQAAKRTAELIPLCHPLPIDFVDVKVSLDEDNCLVTLTAEVKSRGVTGVEMEALTAAAVGALALYDMGKAVDPQASIEEVRVLEKSGGKSDLRNARVLKVSVGDRPGQKTRNVPRAEVRPGYGIVGDCHAGTGRQVSLLPYESFRKLRHPDLHLAPGDFAENLTTSGLDFRRLVPGVKLRAGPSVLLEVTEIGKECHEGCAIRELAGDCIMPREGVFARVLEGGIIKEGDPIVLISSPGPSPPERTSIVLEAAAPPAETATTPADPSPSAPGSTASLPKSAPAQAAPSASAFRVAVVTVSDRSARGEREDAGGPILAELLARDKRFAPAETHLVADEGPAIESLLRRLTDRGRFDLILTTGGTGFSPRDVTPEATRAVIERPAPGIDETIRDLGRRSNPRAALSRGVSGIRWRTLIVNLPGSPRALGEVVTHLLPLLAHGLEVLRGEAADCAPAEGRPRVPSFSRPNPNPVLPHGGGAPRGPAREPGLERKGLSR